MKAWLLAGTVLLATLFSACGGTQAETSGDKREEQQGMEQQAFTVDTPIEQVMEDPAFGNYGRLLFPVNQGYYSGDTLGELQLTYYSHIDPEKTVEIANYLKDRALAGQTVFYDIYTPEEKAQDPAKENTGLFFFKGEPGAKFAICNAGGAFAYVGAMHDSFPHALELSKRGYNAFALIYRPGAQTACEDLARAIRFVMDNADTFGVSTEDYALLGYSSGGQIAGVFGNEEKGWGRYGVPKPGVLLLAYPINNFFGAKPAYHLLMDTDRLERRYYSYTVSKLVTPDYPPTFLWYGRNDLMLKAFVYPLQGPTLAKALEASGVPNRVEVYDNAKHGIGIGVGTDAEDWVERAAEFWQSVSE